MGLSWIPKLLVGLGILLAVGFADTRLLVGDGSDRFAGEERAIAQDALLSAQIGCLDHPVVSMLIRRIRIVEAKFEPRCREEGPSARQGYRAVLRAYTFFVIPAGTISVRCGEVVCGGRGWGGLFWPS